MEANSATVKYDGSEQGVSGLKQTTFQVGSLSPTP